jgi:hypothetical protein
MQHKQSAYQSMNATTASSPDLSTLLASMDAVDAARNSEQQLDEAVNLDARKQVLRDKLRSTYAAQKIAVSDDVINKGVDDFFESRYVFQPMPKGVNSVLASLYVARNRIAKTTAGLMGVFVLGWILVLAAGGAHRAHRAYRANAKIEAARMAEAKVIADRLEAERAEVARQKAAVVAEAARVAELAAFPDRIKAISDACLNVALEEQIRTRVSQIAVSAVALAKAGDVSGARSSYSDLNSILAQLNLEYDLRINLNGRKGGSDWVTGGWRDFRGQKRYYLVVNAVRNGDNVAVPVRSEEDGTVSTVRSWAEQVPAETFEKVKAEKMGNGTVRDTLFGQKRKGYMEPTYLQGPKSGRSGDAGAFRITRW